MIGSACELVTDEAGLERLAPEWDALWSRIPRKTPFQSPAWLLPWWRQFGTPRPVVSVLRDGDRPIGILPCYVLTEAGASKLLPIGIGLSDYIDALVAPEAPADAVDHLLAAVLTAAEDVATCDLTDLAPDAALLGAKPPPGWLVGASPGEPCPVIRLPPGMCDLAAVVPAKMRRKLRMNQHRAERIGGWTTRLASADTLPDDLDMLMRFHQARWTSQGEPGVFADPRVGRFHRQAAPLLLAAGLLRLMTLHVGETVAACCMALSAPPDALFLYLSGFDDEFAFVSPGTILLGDIIEAAMRDGMRDIHLLRGGERYKYAWGGDERRNAALHLSRRP